MKNHHTQSLQLTLPFTPPYDFTMLMDYFAARQVSSYETIDNNRYQRHIRFNNDTGCITVTQGAGDHLLLELSAQLAPHRQQITSRVRNMFDLDCDPQRYQSVLGQDPILKPLIDAHVGIRVPGCWHIFEQSIRAIIGQQVSVKAATTLMNRFVHHCHNAFYEPAEPVSFPSAQHVLSINLSGLGLTANKIKAINALSQFFIDGGEKQLTQAANINESVRLLTVFPGIGEWTANYICMRALVNKDAFVNGDIMLKSQVMKFYGLSTSDITPKKLRDFSQKWRPYRAYATQLLWAGI